MFMRSVEELKTIEDSMRFAHMPVDQLRMDVARALAALPHKYRQIILLRDLEELTIGEIARRLSISGEAAKSLLRRARAAARTRLTESAP
jgi:RNA polymerase sigma factor (sigma-70 family)